MCQNNSEKLALDRIFAVTNCKTQKELANYLNLAQSSVALVKKKAKIPNSWLIKLVAQLNLNPEWILYGSQPKFLDKNQAKIKMNDLSSLPNKCLIAELERRLLTK